MHSPRLTENSSLRLLQDRRWPRVHCGVEHGDAAGRGGLTRTRSWQDRQLMASLAGHHTGSQQLWQEAARAFPRHAYRTRAVMKRVCSEYDAWRMGRQSG